MFCRRNGVPFAQDNHVKAVVEDDEKDTAGL